MERMEVLSTNRPDWPQIQELVLASNAQVEESNMEKRGQWELKVSTVMGDLSGLRDQLKAKTPQTTCSEIFTCYQLLFTTEDEALLHEIGRTFRVDIQQGHLSENGWHITIEDEKEVLEKTQAFLSEKGISSSLF